MWIRSTEPVNKRQVSEGKTKLRRQSKYRASSKEQNYVSKSWPIIPISFAESTWKRSFVERLKTGWPHNKMSGKTCAGHKDSQKSYTALYHRINWNQFFVKPSRDTDFSTDVYCKNFVYVRKGPPDEIFCETLSSTPWISMGSWMTRYW